MIPHPHTHLLPVSINEPLSPAELQDLQNTCRDIATRGGPLGELAERMLRVSLTMQAASEKADQFLARYR